MESRLLVADLRSQAGVPATISCHDPELCTLGYSSTIAGYRHLPNGTDNSDVDSRHTKAIIRGHNVAAKVADLVNNHGGKRETASMRVMGSGFLKRSPAGAGQQSLHDAILWFEKTQFRFQVPTITKDPSGSLESTHYLHFSNPLAEIVPGLRDDGDLSNVTLMSGSCLFSEKMIHTNSN